MDGPEGMTAANSVIAAFSSVTASNGRPFGSPALGIGGASDDAVGVQWNAWFDLKAAIAYFGINLEGMAYRDWPIATVLLAERERGRLFRASRTIDDAANVTVSLRRDCWQAAARLAIREGSIAPTPVTLDRLREEEWRAAIAEALGCLDENRGFRGRAKQRVTLASGRVVEKQVSPHLQFWCHADLRRFKTDADAISWMQRAKQTLEPLYAIVQATSMPTETTSLLPDEPSTNDSSQAPAVSDDVAQLRDWYANSVRPFLLDQLPDRVPDLDAALARVQAHDHRVNEELAICFLGDSGVGKSTLINALVAGHEVVLPAGGIGPLTALAMEVRYGPDPAFEAEYHSVGPLWKGVIFGLERGYEKQLKEATGRADAPVPQELLADSEGVSEPAVNPDDPEGKRSLEMLRKQAQLLVKGDQDTHAELPYLLDCLREVIGHKRHWQTQVERDDVERLEALKKALAYGKSSRRHRRKRAEDPAAFDQDLRVHASGFLAPLIKTLHVRWPSDLLKAGIVLVDLPGVGVAGDAYRSVTRKWVNERAKAVVSVVGRSGLTEAGADLLRTSGFLTRLLFSNDDRAQDPVVLAVAMTHVDSVAETEFQKDRSRRKVEHLANQFALAKVRVRSQLKQELDRVWSSNDDAVRSGQAGVIEELCQNALVFPVTAPQYQRLLADYEDDRPFITHADQSGVPAMQQGILQVVEDRRSQARRAKGEAVELLCNQIHAIMRLLREQWAGAGHTEQEVAALQRDLDDFMAPLREEFLLRRGQFRGFLKNTMPERIKRLVGDAKDSARKEIVRYLRGLRDVYWSTLRAAVRREGAFDGRSRYINLPDDFAQRFVEPVAGVWGQSIIQEIRRETRNFAADCERQVHHVASWCARQGARIPPRLLEAQIDAIKADLKQIDIAGRDIVNELREQVKNHLGKTIQRPIQAKCRSFVTKGDDMGPGVKLRIHELFDTLAEETTDAAAAAAETLLLGYFKQVEEELRTILRKLDDPLENAKQEILNVHRGRVERSDARQRDRVLGMVASVLAARPASLSQFATGNHA